MASKKTTGTAAQISANLEAARKAGGNALGDLVGHGDAAKFGSGAIPTDAAGLNTAFGKSDIKVSGGSSGSKSSGGSSSNGSYKGYDPKLFGGSPAEAKAKIDAHIAQQASKSGGQHNTIDSSAPRPGEGGIAAAGGGLSAGGSGGIGGGGLGTDYTGGASGQSQMMKGLAGAMGGGNGGGGGGGAYIPPAPGLRAGLGQRAYPQQNLALAMLRKAY